MSKQKYTHSLQQATDMILSMIEDSELEARIRLGEPLVLRIRKSKRKAPSGWLAASAEDRELVVDLCEPLTETRVYKICAGGGRWVEQTIRPGPGTADDRKVLWQFGVGKIDDGSMRMLRAAAEKLGWTVDDWVLRNG